MSDTETTDKLLVVGIGASAGGLRSMIELLEYAICNKSMCFVVVSHLPRFQETQLPSILEKVSELATLQITDGLQMKPCHLYTIPPNHYVECEGETLRLQPRPNHAPNLSADVFLKSLAENFKQNAIGVILSGADVGSDGAEGIKHIAEAGGYTFAQDPATALFPGMPLAAIKTGHVRTVATPSLIGHDLSLISWVQEAQGAKPAAKPDAQPKNLTHP